MGDIGTGRASYEVLPLRETVSAPTVAPTPPSVTAPHVAHPLVSRAEGEPGFPTGRRANWLTRTARALR